MELNIGDKCELEVIDLCCNASGYDYLFTQGPDGRTHNVYNIVKYQYTDIPDKIHGIVTGIDIYGKLKIKQDECLVLQEHYELGHLYPFKISDCRRDKNDKQYYVIEDDFSYQRWYSEEDLLIGDDVILEAKNLTNSGYINYSRYQQQKEIQNPPVTPITVTARPETSNHPLFDGGNESETVEYKTSIVFLPESNEADIDKQLFNIIREISAFMNAKGGTLYIGVHDKTHQIVGIEDDLPHLCEGVSPYANSYSADYDHYELKIRDTLVSLCSAHAGSLVKVSFPKEENVKYCRIDVEAANRPIWMKGNMLFQRQGNQTQMLRGEDLTLFVGERIGSYIVSRTGNVSGDISQKDMSELIRDAVKSAINDRRAKVAAPIVLPNTADIKYWVVWFNDGTWLRQREQSADPNVFKQIPVTEDTGDILVAFCYESGTLNTVRMRDFKRGANLGRVCRGGMNINEKPKEIYICHPAYLIAIHSADAGGTEYIKLHHVSDVNPTGNGRNQGPYIIPRNQGHVLDFKLITPVQADNMRAIIAQRRDTLSFGFPLHGIDIQDAVDYLESI